MYLESIITLPKPFEDYSNPSKIVLSLFEGFYNAGYNLTLDNLYTSPEFFFFFFFLSVLFENKTDAYGTLRKKRTCRQIFGHGSQQMVLASLQR